MTDEVEEHLMKPRSMNTTSKRYRMPLLLSCTGAPIGKYQAFQSGLRPGSGIM